MYELESVDLYKKVNDVVQDYYHHLDMVQKNKDLSEASKKSSSWFSFNKVDIIIAIVVLLAMVLPINGFVELAIYVAAVCYKTMERNSNKKKAEEYMNEAYKEMEIVKQIADENAEYITAVPADYRFPLATNYIYTLFRDNRVSNLNEALKMADEQLHRWKMENMNEQMLLAQQQQAATLQSIKSDTSWLVFSDTLDLLFR